MAENCEMQPEQKNILESQRLTLRELCDSDFEPLCEILTDAETMRAYEHAFSLDEVRAWLAMQQSRYKTYGFGLWAVCLKDGGRLIGQCGVTMQNAGGKEVHEVGYLFNRAFWHNGYATEAARACKAYAFERLRADEVYSIIRDNNFVSRRVAERNGMRVTGSFTKHYYNVDMPHLNYCVTRAEYEAETAAKNG